ncbi:ABC transporter ATP-binding protein [Foetidibacter luteolus]|uniref:ABC transporter ATP-binding protein n=1 Tax=Foetidibacter luteolus TaxID=2608880 RepID=UPI00129B4126|nr:ABC transporter ATP-binding protein [Foetidibacter luteolus]
MSFLQVNGVGRKEGNDWAIKDISFNGRQFHKIAIAGETGSGKSTLLKTIAGLTEPDAGTIRFEGERVWGPAYKLVPGHPGIAYLSQQFELPNYLTVAQALEYANLMTDEEAETLYQVCRINHLLQRRTDHLSGGEKQRIALARLLSTSPKLLLLDEPFSNLDMIHKNVLKSVISDLGEKLGITCMLISHDPLDTLSWADEMIILRKGEIIQTGPPEQVYRNPADEYVAGLLGRYNLLPAEIATGFTRVAVKEPTGRKLFTRPEDLVLSVSGSGIQGTILQLKFYGSAYEAEVQLGRITVTARTQINTFSQGDAVMVNLTGRQRWYLD